MATQAQPVSLNQLTNLTPDQLNANKGISSVGGTNMAAQPAPSPTTQSIQPVQQAMPTQQPLTPPVPSTNTTTQSQDSTTQGTATQTAAPSSQGSFSTTGAWTNNPASFDWANYKPTNDDDYKAAVNFLSTDYSDPDATKKLAALTASHTGLSTVAGANPGLGQAGINFAPTTAQGQADLQNTLNKQESSYLDQQIKAATAKAQQQSAANVSGEQATTGAVNREGVQSAGNQLASNTLVGSIKTDLSTYESTLQHQITQQQQAQAQGNTQLADSLGKSIASTQAVMQQKQMQYSQFIQQGMSTALNNNALATGNPQAIAGVAQQLQTSMGLDQHTAQAMAESMAKYQSTNFGNKQQTDQVKVAQDQANLLGTYIDKGIPISENDYLSMSKQSGIPVSQFMQAKSRIDATNARTDIDTQTKSLLNQKELAQLPFAAAQAAAQASAYDFRTETDPNTGLPHTVVYNKVTGQRVDDPSSLTNPPPQNVSEVNYQGQKYIGYDANSISQTLGINANDFKAQCGHLVNVATGIGVGDSYQSKLSKCDPNITKPQPGLVFVMPTGEPYGHTGIVAGVSADGSQVLAYDANWNNKSDPGSVQIHPIDTSKITGYAQPQVGSKLSDLTAGQNTSSKVTYQQYGKLADTDFNPSNNTDNLAKQYLQTYFNNTSSTEPTARQLGLTGQGGSVLFRDAVQRANDLYQAATGDSLPAMSDLKTSKELISGNQKLLNNLNVQEGTVSDNFKLALDNMKKNDLNGGWQAANSAWNNIQNALGDPASAQYLSQNATIQNELGSLIAIKNASGTTVHDKLESAGILPKDASADQQKQIIQTLMQEAENGRNNILRSSGDLYKTADPLQLNKNNPDRQLATLQPKSQVIQNYLADPNISDENKDAFKKDLISGGTEAQGETFLLKQYGSQYSAATQNSINPDNKASKLLSSNGITPHATGTSSALFSKYK